jgi:hypothetical protein
MPDFCTCGAELPPDARFCHRCGKPQREEVIPETAEGRAEIAAAAAPVPPSAAALPGVSFHNPVAVRIGLTMGGAAAVMTWLPIIQFGFAIWWISAGFFSVYLYRRRTGHLLNVASGLRMGWVTGVLTSAILTVLITLTLVLVSLHSGGLPAFYQEQLRTMQWDESNIQQAVKALNSPAVLVTSIMSFLLFVFAIVTFFCTAGGALGAKFGGRQ